MAELLYQQLLDRNARETTPFVLIHEAHTTLLNQIDALQTKCEGLEREIVAKEQQLEEFARAGGGQTSSNGSGGNNRILSSSAALKNETRLRDKLEKLQEELNEKLKLQAEHQAQALQTTKELSDLKDVAKQQEHTISTLKEEDEKKQKVIDHLTTELDDAKSRTQLAEVQYSGLKDSIRILQEENDTLKKENTEFENRLVSEKEKMTEEMMTLTEMVERLKKEVDMLHSLKAQEEKRKNWFGNAAVGSRSNNSGAANTNARTDDADTATTASSSSRKWGSLAVVIPSKPKHLIQAHRAEVSCVRYDGSGSDLVATGSSESFVKVWDASNGSLRATLRSGSGNAIIACDISNGVVIGAGSDKTCRVWNMRTERMIHRLVGHAHKITCVRLFGGERAVITGSADRSLKVWDISRRTYRQTVTLRHSSTANSVDVGTDAFTVVSGHLDGGLRFWDVRTGERTADIPHMHEGGITSVQFHPKFTSQVLTSGMDSCVKIVDIRTCSAIFTLRDRDYQVSYGWASTTYSPDGNYVASGSSATGLVFVWDAIDGKLQKKLRGHEAGVYGTAWSKGGSSGQQVATVDRDGTLILWA